MKGKNWSIFGTIMGLIGGICGVAELVANIKSKDYDENQMYIGLEERYGLTPVENNEEAE